MTLLATVFNLDDTLVDGMVDAMARGESGRLPGVAELVALAAELGPVGIVSASPRRCVRAAASASGIRRHVQVIVSAEDVVHGRPAPGPHLLAARRLDLEPAQCLAVEGSGPGIRSAHAAGMTVLAVHSSSIAPDDLGLAAVQAADARVAAKAMCQLWVEVYALSR